MTKLAKSVKSICATILMFFTSLIAAFTQETSKLDVDINLGGTKSEVWYTQTWVWIVGGLIFILLLVALLRGGGNNRN